MLSLEKQTALKVKGLLIQVLLSWIMISVAVSSIPLLTLIFLFFFFRKTTTPKNYRAGRNSYHITHISLWKKYTQ